MTHTRAVGQDDMEQRAREILFNCGYTTQRFRDFLPKINFPGGLPLLLEVMTEFATAFARQEVAAERQRIFKAICIDCDKPVEEFRGHLVHWFDKELLQYAICQVEAIRQLGGTE